MIEGEEECKRAEMYVLGEMLAHSRSVDIGLESLDETDFWFDDHKIIFSSIREMNKDGKPVNIDSIFNLLQRNGKANQINKPLEYLLHLVIHAGTSTDIDFSCQDLKAFSMKRSLIEVGKAVISEVQKGVDPKLVLQRLETKADAIKAKKSNASSLYRHLLEPVSEKDIADEIRNISPGARVGIAIGEIDLKIPGGALSIIALPTGHGKTLVMINMILNFLSIYPDKKAFFFSYEESRAAILSLFLNTFVNLELSKNNRESIKSYFRDGSPNYIYLNGQAAFITKKDEFFKTLIEPGRLNIFYCDYSAEELVEALRFLKKKTDVGLVGIDYMQLLALQNKKNIQRQEELKQICLLAKDCAVDTGLPIIVAAQFNRTVVNEATISPVAIGEAGDIERASNMVIGGWNRNYEGFSKEGNVNKKGDKVTKEAAIYLEILKGRETGIGHSTILNLNGNTGKLTPKISSQSTKDLFG